jgi:peptide/nickel transport system permease protein
LIFFAGGWSYRFLGFIPVSRHLVGAAPGASFYPLGADKLGRDVLSRVMAGSKTSLLVVMTGILVYGVLGLAVGAAAGLRGGWTDSLLMRFSEFVLALPALYLLLALRAVLPEKLPGWQAVLAAVGIIAAVTWPPMARGVRGLIVQLRGATFVEAARSLGCSHWQIFRRHMLPALLPFVLAQSAVAAPLFLLGEIFLSFLGAGFGEVNESWGALLRDLQDLRVITEFWWNLTPLAFVFATLLSLNVLGGRHRRKELANISL